MMMMCLLEGIDPKDWATGITNRLRTSRVTDKWSGDWASLLLKPSSICSQPTTHTIILWDQMGIRPAHLTRWWTEEVVDDEGMEILWWGFKKTSLQSTKTGYRSTPNETNKSHGSLDEVNQTMKRLYRIECLDGDDADERDTYTGYLGMQVWALLLIERSVSIHRHHDLMSKWRAK